MRDENTYYIINAKVLPEVFLKTLQAKELLQRGEASTVNEAVEKVGMSRSAYYKYKDYVFPFYEISKGKVITIDLLLEHFSGILSEVLNKIADVKGSILTINQNIPAHGVANVVISIETKDMSIHVEELMAKIKKIAGVREIRLLAKE